MPRREQPKRIATPRTTELPTPPALASANGSAASLKAEIASLKKKLRQRMKVERTARVATTRWGGTIYKLRAARQMSCTEVARACGKTNAYVTTMETGKKHNPTLDTIERLARAFGMKASELVKAYEEHSPQNDDQAEARRPSQPKT
jgi:DNA-binding Xre family transcriptional regulator